MATDESCFPYSEYELARVLLVDDDPAPVHSQNGTGSRRLQRGAAASAAEAVGKLDEGEYELVLSDLQMESPEAGLKVLAHARMMDYKPATALLTTYQDSHPERPPPAEVHADQARRTFPGCSARSPI